MSNAWGLKTMARQEGLYEEPEKEAETRPNIGRGLRRRYMVSVLVVSLQKTSSDKVKRNNKAMILRHYRSEAPGETSEGS
jgi:hypothetical protein